MMPWTVLLTCCGRDDMTTFDTWEQADAFRDAYLDAPGHTRSAIITDSTPSPSVEPEATVRLYAVAAELADCLRLHLEGRKPDDEWTAPDRAALAAYETVVAKTQI